MRALGHTQIFRNKHSKKYTKKVCAKCIIKCSRWWLNINKIHKIKFYIESCLTYFFAVATLVSGYVVCASPEHDLIFSLQQYGRHHRQQPHHIFLYSSLALVCSTRQFVHLTSTTTFFIAIFILLTLLLCYIYQRGNIKRHMIITQSLAGDNPHMTRPRTDRQTYMWQNHTPPQHPKFLIIIIIRIILALVQRHILHRISHIFHYYHFSSPSFAHLCHDSHNILSLGVLCLFHQIASVWRWWPSGTDGPSAGPLLLHRTCICSALKTQTFVPDILPASLDDSTTGTATNSVYPMMPSDVVEERPPKHYPYTFPYFLFPPSKIPMALASNGNGPFEVYAYNISSHYAEFEEMSTVHNNEHHSNKHLHHNSHSEHNLHHHSNKHGIGTSTNTGTSSMFDHEWHREQYKLARAKIGEIDGTPFCMIFLQHFSRHIICMLF